MLSCCETNRRTKGRYCGPECELARQQRLAEQDGVEHYEALIRVEFYAPVEERDRQLDSILGLLRRAVPLSEIVEVQRS